MEVKVVVAVLSILQKTSFSYFCLACRRKTGDECLLTPGDGRVCCSVAVLRGVEGSAGDSTCHEGCCCSKVVDYASMKA